MNFKEKAISSIKTTQMKFSDYVAEQRLRSFHHQSELVRRVSLPQGFSADRVRIFWPSFYPWPTTHKWLIPILNEFRSIFEVRYKPMPDYYNATVFEVEIDGKSYPIAIDRFDKVEVNEKCASEVFLYFKMQYSSDGYSFDNIVPGGFIPAKSNIYLSIHELRSIRDKRDFLYDVYGRFGGHFAKTTRGRAVEQLSSQNRFSYYGGIAKVSYKGSLFETARSKVCVDLPGNGPLCFRLIDYLAVGACIVAYPHHAKLPVPLTPGKDIVYCKEDLSDLNEICEFYVSHPEEREQLSLNSRSYFDKYLSRSKLASYYINTIIQHALA